MSKDELAGVALAGAGLPLAPAVTSIDTASLALETRATSLGAWRPADPELARLFGFDPEGIAVNEATALEVSAFFACVKVISETLATLPLRCYRDTDTGGREPSATPIAQLLKWRPNPDMPAFAFVEALTANACIWGESFAEIVRAGNGLPTALWPLDPTRMRAERPARGELRYIYCDPAGGEIEYAADDILHLRHLTGDGVKPYRTVDKLRRVLAIALGSGRHAERFFRDAATPGFVLETPAILTQEAADRLRAAMAARHAGENAHKVPIFEQGLQAKVLGIDPEKSQLAETRAFAVVEICRYFRVPPHLVADLSRSTYSNIEQQSSEFARYCLQPWARRWESELNVKLFWNSDTVAEFAFEGLLRPTTAERYAAYRTGRDGGWLSVNEIRRYENAPPIAGGNEYLRPLNYAPVGDAAGPPQAEQPISEDDQAAAARSARPWLDLTAERLRRRLEHGREAIANKTGEERAAWLTQFAAASARLAGDAARALAESRGCTPVQNAIYAARAEREWQATIAARWRIDEPEIDTASFAADLLALIEAKP